MMSENVEVVRDRSGWGAGPWDGEPDRLQWTDESTGMACLMVRNHMGAWCGYVAVEPGHPAYGKDYDDVAADVHGGLTYSDRCNGDICHVPESGKPANVWWLGFDCCHSFDLAPELRRNPAREFVEMFGSMFEDADSRLHEYRDVAYVKAEVASLAAQLQEQR